MNHTWGKEFKEHEFTTQICNTCGCKRDHIPGGYIYSRSGIIFGVDKRPDCIDEEFEKTKTID